MADYTKMKNADLESLLKERNLPHTGKKADLIKRLQESDASGDAPAAATSSKPIEDEIDWDDEPAAVDASKATTEPAAAAIAAGGQGQVPNPQAVPNQVADINPATTDDLTVAADPASNSTDAKPAEVPVEKEKTPVDFSSGMAMTTLDQEIAKRQARAKKFGMDESKDETLKELERAKKFGSTELPGKLNEALPEKRERKRGRDAVETNDSRKRGRPGPGGRQGSNRRNEGGPAPRANGGGASGLSEADKAAAEKRKQRFASAA